MKRLFIFLTFTALIITGCKNVETSMQTGKDYLH